MAVPKKKTSKSKKNMRRSHHALKQINLVTDERGEYRLAHHISSQGFYNGKQIVVKKEKEKEE